jgi:hypothetical protein
MGQYRPSLAYCGRHARERASELEASGADDDELALIVIVLTRQFEAAHRFQHGSR